MTIELDPTELDYVRRSLNVIANLDSTILPGIMEATAKKLHERVEHYPPELPNQRYVRTDTYRRSTYWTDYRISGGHRAEAGSRGAVQNGRRYDQYLKDERNQADIHRGRWTTLQDDADATMPEFEAMLRAELKAITDAK